jgi:hypothetical protein
MGPGAISGASVRRRRVSPEFMVGLERMSPGPGSDFDSPLAEYPDNMSEPDYGILIDVLVAVEEEAGLDTLDVLVECLEADVKLCVEFVHVPG